MASPEQPALRIRPLVIAAIALVVVVAAGLAIVADPAWSAAEVKVVAAVNGWANPVSDAVALTIDRVFGPQGAAFVAFGVALIAWGLTREWRVPVRLGIAAGGAWAIAELIKHVVQRMRPDPAALPHLIVDSPPSFSYPSGHTAFAAALGAAVVVTLFASRGRRTAVVLAAVVALVTAWSRVYLGVHYITDVTASLILVPPLVLALEALVSAALARWAPARTAP